MLHRTRRVLGTGALVVGSVLAILLAFELSCRVSHGPMGRVIISEETTRKSENRRLRFELRPDSVLQVEVEYRINAEGLRGPEVELEKPEGVRRVAVLGDSIAFGYWVAEEDTFPRQLESMLNEVRGDGPRVEVLSFGVPGYRLDQEIETLRARALPFAPDVVVVAFCLNDFEGLFSYELGIVQDRAARRRSLLGRLREGVLSRSYFFGWVEYRLAEADARRTYGAEGGPFSGPEYERVVRAQRGTLLRQFRELQAILLSHEIEGLVVTFPVFNRDWEDYPHRGLHRVVLEAAADAGLHTTDLLRCYQAYRFQEVRVDDAHPNPMGHRVAAHAIRDVLCREGILCPGPIAEGPTCRDYRPRDFPTVVGPS